LTTAEISAASDPVEETTEWQHLFRAVCDAFGVTTRCQTLRRYPSAFHTTVDQILSDAGGEYPLRLMAAPTTDPSRRANTADAFAFFAQRIPAEQRRRVLVITSAIYVPYQFLIAAPGLLDDGSSHVEVIGTPTAVDDHQNLLAQRIGQEIHAVVIAAAPLWR
jgi:hypothetical protein